MDGAARAWGFVRLTAGRKGAGREQRERENHTRSWRLVPAPSGEAAGEGRKVVRRVHADAIPTLRTRRLYVLAVRDWTASPDGVSFGDEHAVAALVDCVLLGERCARVPVAHDPTGGRVLSNAHLRADRVRSGLGPSLSEQELRPRRKGVCRRGSTGLLRAAVLELRCRWRIRRALRVERSTILADRRAGVRALVLGGVPGGRLAGPRRELGGHRGHPRRSLLRRGSRGEPGCLELSGAVAPSAEQRRVHDHTTRAGRADPRCRRRAQPGLVERSRRRAHGGAAHGRHARGGARARHRSLGGFDGAHGGELRGWALTSRGLGPDDVDAICALFPPARTAVECPVPVVRDEALDPVACGHLTEESGCALVAPGRRSSVSGLALFALVLALWVRVRRRAV